MTTPALPRRDFLEAGLALAAATSLGGLSGCLERFGFGGENGDERLDLVPSNAQFVMGIHVANLFEDEALIAGIDEGFGSDLVASHLGADPNLPGDVEGMADLFDAVEDSLGLDPMAVEDAVLFGTEGNVPEDLDEVEQIAGIDDVDDLEQIDEELLEEAFDDEGGAVLWTDWDEDDVRDRLTALGDLEEGTYRERTVYILAGGMVTQLGEGRVAIGSVDAIETVIDILDGETDPLSGAVRETYHDAPAGDLRFGFEVPAALLDAVPAGAVNEQLVSEITHGRGGVRRPGEGAGDERELVLSLEASDANVGDDLERALNGAIAFLQVEFDEEDVTSSFVAAALRVAEDVVVSRDGAVVTLSYTQSADELGQVLGLVWASLAQFLPASF